MLFVCLAALAAMNAMLMGRIGLGILTGLGVGMVAYCVAILIEASLKFMFSDISKHPGARRCRAPCLCSCSPCTSAIS